jgi:transcriptional regulator with XRE-family HTH domain
MSTAIREGGKLSAMATPTVRRLQLGKELARLRTRAGVRVDQAAKAIDRSGPVVSRLENGETGLRRLDLRMLLEFYAEQIQDNDPVDIEWFLEFNVGAENRGRWSGYRSVHPKFFRMAVDLEADAASIDAYQPEVMFGLFQTEQYMRSLFTGMQVRRATQHQEDLLGARLERQQILDKENAPEIRVVLSESALLRLVGTPKVMQDQLYWLAELSEKPNLQIQILTFRCRTVSGAASPFTRFRVPALHRNAPPLEFVFVDTYGSGEYIDSNEGLSDYNALWSGLLGAALDPVESRDYLINTAKNYT